MPVEPKKIAGKVRVVEQGGTRLARNEGGTPVDGGGFPVSKADWAKAGAQSGHLNKAWRAKHGGDR